MKKILDEDLKPCDVLLFHGASFISKLIRLVDGEPYSHAAIYIGTNPQDDNKPYVAEMLGNGLNYRSLEKSIADTPYVDVFRYYGTDGKIIEDKKPILERENFYQGNGERYAYEEILLLALLCSTRKLSIPIIAPIIDHILDTAADVIANLIAKGKEPMICSELVYRCYSEAIPSYPLLVKEAASAHSQATTPLITDHELTFIQNYLFSTDSEIANFVTPNDLARCPNLQKQGTLK